MLKWLESPAVDPELKDAHARTLALVGQIDSVPEQRLGALADLVERMRRLAESWCVECGAPIRSEAGEYCSEQCRVASETRNRY